MSGFLLTLVQETSSYLPRSSVKGFTYLCLCFGLWRKNKHIPSICNPCVPVFISLLPVTSVPSPFPTFWWIIHGMRDELTDQIKMGFDVVVRCMGTSFGRVYGGLVFILNFLTQTLCPWSLPEGNDWTDEDWTKYSIYPFASSHLEFSYTREGKSEIKMVETNLDTVGSLIYDVFTVTDVSVQYSV